MKILKENCFAKNMNKLLLAIFLLSAMFTAAQSNITVTFKAENSDGTSQRLDTVKITDETQGWSQTLVYPDITMTLDYEDGIEEPLSTGGLSHNFPNPFSGSTEMVLSLEKDEQTCIRIVGMDGKILVERNISLPQGEHRINVSLDKPQLALIHVTTAHHSYTIKLLNIGEGGSNNIEVCKLVQTHDRNSKSGDEWFFALGDVMSYTGVAVLDEDNVITSNTVTQALYHDDTITLVFDIEIPEEPQLPTVTTSEISNITYTTAVCGGEVINDGGAEVTARGVCWATTENPTTSDSITTDGNGLGEYASSLSNLTAGTTYYVRAYAINSVGTAYGNEVNFIPQMPQGALNGIFSVSETKQVCFSQGNLQYNAAQGTHSTIDGGTAQGTWRFADNQWYYIGEENSNISETYDGWIDLFGWATSGWDNGGVCYQPWSFYMSDDCYYPDCDENNGLTGNGAYADWGVYNAISNGGNEPGLWRTMTKEEWDYLFNSRPTNSGMSYTMAQVNNVNGIILLPDEWDSSIYNLNSTNKAETDFSINVIDTDTWTNIMEPNGAVFLPTASFRKGTETFYNEIYGSEIYGYYWSASCSVEHGFDAWEIMLCSFVSSIDMAPELRYYGQSVRLVTNAN